MPMKFLHTADWQVGMKAAHVASRAREVRDERVAAGRRVVDAAIAHGADFLVVAGDTFEDNAVDRLLVQRVADVLDRFPGRVFVLPGNHDPLCAGSVWDHPAWPRCTRVTICRDRSPIVVDGGTLWPCPLFEKIGRRDPTRDVPPRDAPHGIRVGLAHGSVEGIDAEDRYFPIARDAAERAGLDYLAIGHWHSFAPIGPRLVYPGSPEPTKFGERESGRAVLVEIDAPESTPKLTPIRTGRLAWQQWDESCAEPGAIDKLVERIDRMYPAVAGATLLDVSLHGPLSPDDVAMLARLRELAAARLFFHRIDTTRLRPAPDAAAAWIATLPEGAIRAAAERLRRLADPTVTDERPAEATPDVAARALLELFAIADAAARGGDA
jgi:DNA repair exonuclease SbcCD nuclease subunit